MEKRILGRIGREASIFGFGGVVVMGMEQSEANSVVAEAIDGGITYFDVAPSYGDAEERLGPALMPYREKVFLACKTIKRTKKEVEEELASSLRRLRTDHIDTYQMHALDKKEDIDTALGRGGALEAFIEAREKGLIRYIGFSAHTEEGALRLMDEYDFDSILFPINWVYWLKGGVGEKVLEKARSRNMACIAMKALAHRRWREGEERSYPNCWYRPIFDDPKLAELALRFTLSQPVHVAISPGDIRMLRLGMKICERFTPISSEELAFLSRAAEGLSPIFTVA